MNLLGIRISFKKTIVCRDDNCGYYAVSDGLKNKVVIGK